MERAVHGGASRIYGELRVRGNTKIESTFTLRPTKAEQSSRISEVVLCPIKGLLAQKIDILKFPVKSLQSKRHKNEIFLL